MGQASAAIHAVEPASKIMDEMVAGALSSLRRGVGMAAKLKSTCTSLGITPPQERRATSVHFLGELVCL